MVCPAAKLPLSSSPQIWHEAYGFGLAVLTFAIVFGAFAANVLLGVEDIVYWARELGGSKRPRFTDYPHGDWRVYYFGALLVFYLCFTRLSEIVLARVMTRPSHHGRRSAKEGGVTVRCKMRPRPGAKGHA